MGKIRPHLSNLKYHVYDPNREGNSVRHLYWGDRPIASAGNIVGIVGREGSRKSLFTRCMAASLYNSDNTDYSLNFKWNPWRDNMRTLFMDTEQSEDDHHRLHSKFLRIAGLPPTGTQTVSFELQSYDYGQLLDQLDFLVHRAETKNNPYSLVVLDQLADFVPDENDREYSKYLITSLLGLAKKYNFIIFVVMHTNRGNHEANGALGSLLQKKAQAMFLIHYDKETKHSIAEHRKSRVGRTIEDFKFWHNEERMPELIRNLPK